MKLDFSEREAHNKYMRKDVIDDADKTIAEVTGKSEEEVKKNFLRENALYSLGVDFIIRSNYPKSLYDKNLRMIIR